jgi:hypothetical protein
LSGWDVMILSDQLIVRNYSSHEAWRPGPLTLEPTKSPPGPGPSGGQPSPAMSPQIQNALSAIVSCLSKYLLIGLFDIDALVLLLQPEPQRGLVAQVCERTGLNVQYAVDCLGGNGWDLGRAVANFEQVKVRIHIFDRRVVFIVFSRVHWDEKHLHRDSNFPFALKPSSSYHFFSNITVSFNATPSTLHIFHRAYVNEISIFDSYPPYDSSYIYLDTV